MPRLKNKKKIYFYIFSFFLITTIFNHQIFNNIGKIFIIKDIYIKTGSEGINKKVLSKINFLINKSIFNINKKDIYTKIYELDYLQNIKIYKNYPSTIIISGKETSLIAITYIDQEKYFVGNNEKFISTRKISNTKNLPTIFGKFKVSDFKSLKIKLIESELDISKIEKYYYHKNKRWDLYFTNNIILKLPSENISNAIKLYNKFKDLKKINSNTIIDLRVPNRLVIKNG